MKEEQKSRIEHPKVFISYCWTNDEFTELVLNLATRLREDGVDILLDKWDVEPGGDIGQFMERMVADETVTKVIIVSNRLYSEKSNKRHGGVGAEAQIISSEIYNQQDSNKFVVAAFEWDYEKEKPYLPAYYGMRKYIDFFTPSKHDESYEELLRCIYGRPLYRKPQLGTAPSFLFDENPGGLQTNSKYRQAIHDLENNTSRVMGSLRDYLDAFIDGLGSFQIVNEEGRLYYELLFDSIDLFSPYKKEWITVLNTCVRYCKGQDYLVHYLRFFENFYKYTFVKPGNSCFGEYGEDNYKFFLKDLFISFIAMLLKYGELSIAGKVWKSVFYCDDVPGYDEDSLYTYMKFDFRLGSIYEWASNQTSRPFSPVGHKLINSLSDLLTKSEYIQADCLCYLYSVFHDVGYSYHDRWIPQTLLYAISGHQGTFEVFARSQSREYLTRVLNMLSISSKEAFVSKMREIQGDDNQLIRWSYYAPNFDRLLNLNNLGSLE